VLQKPHCTVFAAPELVLAEPNARLEWALSILLDPLLFQIFLGHSRVSLIDPEDNPLTDPDGRLLNARHSGWDELLASLQYDWRRDECLWLELHLDATPGACTLHSRRPAGPDSFDGPRGQPLSVQLDACLKQWLEARELDLLTKRVESFDVPQLLQAARKLDEFAQLQAKAQAANRPTPFEVPPVLVKPYCQAAFTHLGEVEASLWLLGEDPKNPWALREHFLQDEETHPDASRDPLREAVKLAPQFGKPYLALVGEGVTLEESLDALATAALLLPGNTAVLTAYANTLIQQGRWEEAHRYAERALRIYPLYLPAHLTALDAKTQVARVGEALNEADARIAYLERSLAEGQLEPTSSELCIARLRRTDVYMDAGRLDEAVVLREEALSQAKATRERWPRMFALLDQWRTSSGKLALCAAREAAHRFDPGRVLDLFGLVPPEDGHDVARLIDAHVSLGQDDLALLAASQFEWEELSQWAEPRLAAAKALLVGGLLPAAVEHLQSVQLRFPQGRFEGAINRLLRLGATLPAEAWEAQIQRRLDAGAIRLAKLLARDACDFVPDLERSAVVTRALGERKPLRFDPAWLAPLRKALAPLLGGAALDRIDAFFAERQLPTLAHADRLAQGWHTALDAASSGRPLDPRALLYLLAQSLCRYLALCTQPANVLSGGLRQVATDALQAITLGHEFYTDELVRPLLGAFERLAQVDPWLFDVWLLRVERALDLETRRGAHLENCLQGLEQIPAFLRGDECIGYELRVAGECAAEGRHEQAQQMYERGLRAVGGSVAPAYAASIQKFLVGAEKLDALWLAHLASPRSPEIVVPLAKMLFEVEQMPLAFELLCDGLPWIRAEVLPAALEQLRVPFEQAALGIPFDLAGASRLADERMRAKDAAGAVAALRWCRALSPRQPQVLQRLGAAYAELGWAERTLTCFNAAARGEGGGILAAAQALRDADRWPEAVKLYRFAERSFRTAEGWLALGGAAWFNEDDELAADAYSKAFEVQPSALDASQLAAYATALNNVGRYAEALSIADRLEKSSGGDSQLEAASAHAKARALLGQGKFEPAATWVRRALEAKPSAPLADVYQATLALCTRREMPSPPKQRSASLSARAREALQQGAFARARELAEQEGSWVGARLVMAAVEYRDAGDSDRVVSRAASEVYAPMLEQTQGLLDLDAVLVRLQALRLRENALVPVDAPPRLGPLLTRETFEAKYLERMSAEAQTGPQLNLNTLVIEAGSLSGHSKAPSSSEQLPSSKPRRHSQSHGPPSRS
jgi:tetratricopeptide (TPR) repeat protein